MKITWRRVYKIFPIPIVICDRLVPKPYLAYFWVFFIAIKKIAKSDEGLIQHELTHFKQFLRSFGLYVLLRNFPIKKIRDYFIFKYEAEAYARQIFVDGLNIKTAVCWLKNNYGLSDIYTERLIEKEIKRCIEKWA